MRCKVEKTKGAVVLKYASSAEHPFSQEVARRLEQDFPPVLLGFTTVAPTRHSFEAHYEITRLVPLSKYLKTPLETMAVADMFGQFRDLITFCVRDRLPLMNVVFDLDRVYYDSWMRTVRFIYLPFDGIEPRLDVMSAFFVGVARRMRAADEGAGRLIGRYQSFFGDEPFSPVELASYLDGLLPDPEEACLVSPFGSGEVLRGKHAAFASDHAGGKGNDAATSVAASVPAPAAAPLFGDGWQPGVVVDAATAAVPEGRHVQDSPASATLPMDAVPVPAPKDPEVADASASARAKDTNGPGARVLAEPALECPPTTVELAAPDDDALGGEALFAGADAPTTADEPPVADAAFECDALTTAETAEKAEANGMQPDPAAGARETALVADVSVDVEPELPGTIVEIPAASEPQPELASSPESDPMPTPESNLVSEPAASAPPREAEVAAEASVGTETVAEPASDGSGALATPAAPPATPSAPASAAPVAPAPEPAPVSSVPSAAPQRRYLMTRRSTGEQFELRGQEYVVGKSMYCSFQVRDNMTVSRRHVLFFCESDACWMEDNGSTNGTFLNGRRVAPHARVRLRPGDVVSMSDEDFLFEERL